MRRVLPLLLVLAVCGPDEGPPAAALCQTDFDCPARHDCLEGTCRLRAAPDAGTQDAGPPDAGPGDAGPSDAGPGDSGPGADAGPGDAGPSDAGPADSGPADAGPLDAGPTGDAGPTVDWCELHWPTWIWSSAPSAGARIEGQVFEDFLTPGVDTGTPNGGSAKIAGEAGFGPPDTDPRGGGWTWVAAAFDLDVDGLVPGALANDQWDATIHPAVGAWATAFRFSLESGPWVYCDLAGPLTGRTGADKLGHVDADAASVARPDWCNLQHPPATTVAAGQSGGPAFGQILVPGVTNGAGQGAGISAELGVGPRGSSPANPSAGWTWAGAAFNAGCTTACPDNDEYQAPLAAPSTPGGYDYAFRFRIAADPWHFADRNGCPDGYDHRQAGKLTVP